MMMDLRKKTLRAPRRKTAKNRVSKTGHVTAVKTRTGQVKTAVADQALKMAIQRVVKGAEETKYVSKYIHTHEPLRWDLDGTVLTRKLRVAIPEVPVGTASYQRVGNQITPVKLRVTAIYSWDPAFVGHYQPYVRQMLLKSKTIKSGDAWTTLSIASAADYQKTILEEYNGTQTFPNGNSHADPFNLVKPINKSEWTLLKGSKVFHMTKNDGLPNHPEATKDGTVLQQVQPYAGRLAVHKSFDISCPKTFKYDTSASTLPSGFCPLFGSYIGLEGSQDISDTAANGGLGPYYGGNSLPTTPAILINLRVELWFKDA